MRERIIEIDPDEKVIISVRQQTPTIETPAPQPVTDDGYGKLKTKVGIVSDIHCDVDDSNGSMYGDDLINAINMFRREGVDFIASLGDLCEYDDKDLEVFNMIYNNHVWEPTAYHLRFFTAIGNHDYLRLFSDRGQDTDQATERLSQQFRPFNGEDLWQLYGYADKKDYIQFFEYGGQWDKQYVGERTVKGKLSYWVEFNGDIYVFLSVDYGPHADPSIWDWCSKAMNLLNYDDAYVRDMMRYVADTPYDQEKEGKFDYQFYNPNQLIWLKDILANNRDRRVFIFTHHFMPQKAGNEAFDSWRDYYSKLRLWPYTSNKAIQRRYWSGSNTVCGLTFWFLNKLNNDYPNAVWFSGHSHYQWSDDTNNFCTDDYPIVQPSGDEKIPDVEDIKSLSDCGWYTRTCGQSIADCGMNIHVPSLAKPTTNTDGSTLYAASEGAIMEVYERATILLCYTFRRVNDTDYTNELVRKITIPMP